jgi:hypothetical protein
VNRLYWLSPLANIMKQAFLFGKAVVAYYKRVSVPVNAPGMRDAGADRPGSISFAAQLSFIFRSGS